MAITERPVLDQLTLRIDRPADGMFVLGRSTLGGEKDTYAWTGARGRSASTQTSPSGLVLRTNEVPDPMGQGNAVSWVGGSDSTYIDSEGRVRVLPFEDVTAGTMLVRTPLIAAPAGQVRSGRLLAYHTSFRVPLHSFQLRLTAYNSDGAPLAHVASATATLQPYEPGELTANALTLPPTAVAYALELYAIDQQYANDAVYVSALGEPGATAGPYFDGDTADTPSASSAVLGSQVTRVNVLPDAVQTITTNRGLAGDDVATRKVQVGTLSVTFRNALDPEDDANWWVRSGRPIQVATAGGVPIFTGTIGTVRAESRWTAGVEDTYVTLNCTDAVAPLANTTRYGASSGAAWESFQARARRLFSGTGMTPAVAISSSGKTAVGNMTDSNVLFEQYTDAQVAEGNAWRVTEGTGMVSGAVNAVGAVTFVGGGDSESNQFTRTITGITPGKAYQLTCKLWFDTELAVDATLDGQPWTVIAGPSPQFEQFQFIATGTTAAFVVNLPSGYNPMQLRHLSLQSWAYDPYAIGSVVYEGPVASHLDMLVASVPDAIWWVDAAGIPRVQDYAPVESRALLSDTALGQLHYTDLSRELDSGAIVNDLTANNHGRRRAADDAGSTWEDYTPSYGYQDVTSRASWGAAAVAIDTCLASVGALDRLAAATFELNAEPRARISSVTVNAQENPELACQALDVASRISLAYKRTSDTHRVLSVQHTITATRWLITATLGA
ncbi:hypothetical protein [Curtobacterium sp. PhB146]|uniref:hypothetical protein n=1 Tax=Curtobacterium sp. PhB146 TaxID=2485187 RepID=UPI0010459161|nr:hypothetical protein [Curtobacterium sp. PhB146]TCU48349.1 hypothetical protein EDF33_102240 [Curtobacterium sp. PhB146]